MVDRFLSAGCRCDLASRSCSSLFTEDYVHSFRCQCRELVRVVLDMATSTLSVHSTKHCHTPSPRQRAYMLYWHAGRSVCRKTYLFLHTISDKRLRNLQVHHGIMATPGAFLLTLSLSPTRKELWNFSTRMLRQMPFCFLGEYQAISALMCTSCHRAQRKIKCGCSTVQGLSSTHRQAAYSTFCSIWRRVVPRIMVTKPMSDLCWVCQSNSTAIMRAANQPEEMKSEVSTLSEIVSAIR